MFNSLSFITAYHEQLLILGAFLPSSLDVLIEIIFLFVITGGNILENLLLNYFLQLTGGYVGERSALV